MKKKQKNKPLYKIISLILTFLSSIFIFLLYLINIVPLKYFFLILGFFVIFNLCLVTKLLFKKKKKMSFFLSLLIILILPIGIFYEISTLDFLHNFDHDTYKTDEYVIVVLKNSSFSKLEDLNNKKIGYINEDSKNLQKAKREIAQEVKVNYETYKDIDSLVNSLKEKEISAMLIGKVQYEIFQEEEEETANLTKIIDSLAVKTKIKAVVNKTNLSEDPVNIYISGTDSYGSINSGSRSDVNIVITINPQTNQVLITNIPRDYYVPVAGKKGLNDKLTHAGIYGVDTSLKTIANLLDIKIDYYIKINFSSLIKLVDTLGGITVNSNYAFTSQDGFSYKKGDNKLNGEKALSFVRERHAFDSLGGDRIRGENQQLVIKALIDKALNSNILIKYNSLLKQLEKSFLTNISSQNITDLINRQLDKNPKWNIETFNLTGTDANKYTYSYPTKQLYVMIPEAKSISEVKQKIKETLAKT